MIVTFQSVNYGTALQNYALTTKLNSLGFEAYTLLSSFGFEGYCLHRTGVKQPLDISLSKVISIAKKIVKRILGLLGVKKYKKKPISEREKKFIAFHNKYLSKGVFIPEAQVLNHADAFKDFEYVVAGSDMIWSTFTGKIEELRYFNLDFVEPEKRVAYAPSFGLAEFTFNFLDLRKELLSKFRKLSCREQRGCDLIKELTGFDAQHVLDPTMLLSAEHYRTIAKKPAFEIPEHYALIYLSVNDLTVFRQREYANVINAACHGIETINLYFDPSFSVFYDGRAEQIGPEEFLWLIDHADIVIENSFHGTAFSILFHKNFIAMDRASSYDTMKIKDILSTLGILDRKYDNDARIPEGIIDYEAVDKKLNELRETSTNYLRECLDIK